MRAIATNYRGQTFKSRLEGNVAQLIHTMGYAYDYEPESYLLDTGKHYMPDFWIPNLSLWVECRGYWSAEGTRQISDFEKLIEKTNREREQHLEYLVLGPEDCLFYDANFEYSDSARINKCNACLKPYFSSLSGKSFCRNCLQETERQSATLCFWRGKILIEETGRDAREFVVRAANKE